MRYSIQATVNYPDDEVETMLHGDTDHILLEIYRLLDRERYTKATSITFIVVPIKAPHENVI